MNLENDFANLENDFQNFNRIFSVNRSWRLYKKIEKAIKLYVIYKNIADNLNGKPCRVFAINSDKIYILYDKNHIEFRLYGLKMVIVHQWRMFLFLFLISTIIYSILAAGRLKSNHFLVLNISSVEIKQLHYQRLSNSNYQN